MSHSAEYHNPAAYNYSEAMLNLAKKSGRLAQLAEQAGVLLQAVRHERDKLCRFLEGPQIPTQEKMALIERVFAGRVDDLFANLMKLLVKRDRVRLLAGILEVFQEMAAREQGLRTGRVMTAVALSDEEKQRMARSLEAFMRQRLMLRFQVEPYVLGGVVFQSGDEQIDFSVRGRLEGLRKRLESVKL